MLNGGMMIRIGCGSVLCVALVKWLPLVASLLTRATGRSRLLVPAEGEAMGTKEVWEDKPYDSKESAWRAITRDYGPGNKLLANMRKAGLTISFSVRKKGTKFFIVMTIKEK